MSQKHELKTWPTYWDSVARGEKLFEVRKNDRFFQCGDEVTLVRYDTDDEPMSCVLLEDWYATLPRIRFQIGPILQGGQFGIEPGYCVFSLLPIPAQGQQP